MKKERSRQKHINIITIICSAVLIAGVCIATFFGARAIYHKGVDDGRTAIENELSDKISSLGQSVNEKIEFQKIINQFTADLPEIVNSEAIDKYIESIENISKEVSNQKVSELLLDYIDQWKEFKEQYNSKDNKAIEENFNALKSTTADITKQIKTQFDDSIKAAIENL